MRAGFSFRLLAGIGFLGVGFLTSSLQAAYVPPAGFTRTPGEFSGDAFAVAPDGKVAIAVANFGGSASVKVYASAADAEANAVPVRTFTDASYKAWGDLTFTDNDTLLFTENGGSASNDAVYRGIISSGATSNLGNVPNAGGVIAVGSIIYSVAANNPGLGALYQINGGSPAAVISNIGVGYLGGIAIDTSGNLLLTDSNDPDFLGNAGKLLRYTSGFAPLPVVDLADGGGSGAYDVVLDSEGDVFVTTGSTLTQIPFGTTAAEQFGSAFTGFPFITSMDYVGSGFGPNSGNGKLFVNAVFSDDDSIFGITPIPEPATGCLLIGGLLTLAGRRRRSVVTAVGAVGIAAGVFAGLPAHATQFYASQVISRTVGTQPQPGFGDPAMALGGPRGGGTTMNSIDVYNLGNGGSITLGFTDGPSEGAIVNGPGMDFIVSENAFLSGEDPHKSFAELMWVEVSSDGTNFARFPNYSATLTYVGPFGTIDPAKVACFAGVNPVMANIDENNINPFDPAVAGGDAFDLCWISTDPLVIAGIVDVNHIIAVRLLDVIGDATRYDSVGRPIFDPLGPGIGGADVDSIAVINGVHMPEPVAAAPLGAAAVFLLRRKN